MGKGRAACRCQFCPPFAVLATLAALYGVLALLRLRTTAGPLARRPAEDEVGLPAIAQELPGPSPESGSACSRSVAHLSC